MDFTAPSIGNARPLSYTKRGTQCLEFFHPHIHRAIPSNFCGPEKAECNVATRVHQWNVTQEIRRLGRPDRSTYSLPLLVGINAAASRCGSSPPYPEVSRAPPNDYQEQLGVAPTGFLPSAAGARLAVDEEAGSDDEEERDSDDGSSEDDSSPASVDPILVRGDGRCMDRSFLGGLYLHGVFGQQLPPGVDIFHVSVIVGYAQHDRAHMIGHFLLPSSTATSGINRCPLMVVLLSTGQ